MTHPLIYLTTDDIKHIHVRVMSSMGWNDAPLRSEGELESAVARPQHAAFYGEADIAHQAVTLAVGISQNQPFLDGNKRTAMASLRVFLELSGYGIDSDPLPIALHLEATADRLGTLDEAIDAFAAWIRERLIRLDDTSQS